MTEIVMGDPSRVALTTTPSMGDPCGEATWPDNAAPAPAARAIGAPRGSARVAAAAPARRRPTTVILDKHDMTAPSRFEPGAALGLVPGIDTMSNGTL